MCAREGVPEHILEGFRQEWRAQQVARAAQTEWDAVSQMHDALGAVDFGRERQVTVQTGGGAAPQQQAAATVAGRRGTASDHATKLAAAIAKQQEQRLARQQAQVKSNNGPSRRQPQQRQSAPTQSSAKLVRPEAQRSANNEAAQREVQRVAQRNEELRDEVMRLERARAAQCELDALHQAALKVLKEKDTERDRLARGTDDPVSRLAQVNAQRAARLGQLREKEREAHCKAVDARTPVWWPRELRVAPRQPPPRQRPPPPDPEMVAAANKRLDEIRSKLEEGQRLTPDEESDAAAIMELRRVWAARAA